MPGVQDMPFDPELLDRMRDVLKNHNGVVERKMFGGYCWMLRGNMLCGVGVGRYMFRVGKQLEAEALARPGASPMVIAGKPMSGFVWVDADEAAGERLNDWVGFAADFVRTLPPK
jgi:TfoX/Sxy family transcriptional regulator of competence genes